LRFPLDTDPSQAEHSCPKGLVQLASRALAAVIEVKAALAASPVAATTPARHSTGVTRLRLPAVALPAGPDRLASVAALIRRALPRTGAAVSTKGKTE
jgi:hypothetical protein